VRLPTKAEGDYRRENPLDQEKDASDYFVLGKKIEYARDTDQCSAYQGGIMPRSLSGPFFFYIN
jgi:hypothetical protein